jgi:hypothetical protein
MISIDAPLLKIERKEGGYVRRRERCEEGGNVRKRGSEEGRCVKE